MNKQKGSGLKVSLSLKTLKQIQSIYTRFSIRSRSNLSLVIPNNEIGHGHVRPWTAESDIYCNVIPRLSFTLFSMLQKNCGGLGEGLTAIKCQVVSIGYFVAFYVVLVPLEYL